MKNSGVLKDFDFIPGKVKRLPDRMLVPHIGWNQLHLQRSDPLLEGISEDSFVYFVHSYYAEPEDPRDILATTDYDDRVPVHCTARERLGDAVSSGEESRRGVTDAEELCGNVGNFEVRSSNTKVWHPCIRSSAFVLHSHFDIRTRTSAEDSIHAND